MPETMPPGRLQLVALILVVSAVTLWFFRKGQSS